MKKHMQLNEFIILSAELSTLSYSENLVRSLRLLDLLHDLKLPFKQIKGVYKGTSEVSFMVVVKDEAEIDTVTRLAFQSFNHESILFRDYKGNAKLIYSNGMTLDAKGQPSYLTQSIGKFKKVNSVEGEDAYSIVNGEHWLCH